MQAKAGTRAAMDGLKIAESPKDMARVARLAEAKGSKTRAILKLGGRAAIALTIGAFNLASWAFSALVAILGFCATIKGLTERTTLRWLAWRKTRRARRALDVARFHATELFIAHFHSQYPSLIRCHLLEIFSKAPPKSFRHNDFGLVVPRHAPRRRSIQ